MHQRPELVKFIYVTSRKYVGWEAQIGESTEIEKFTSLFSSGREISYQQTNIHISRHFQPVLVSYKDLWLKLHGWHKPTGTELRLLNTGQRSPYYSLLRISRYLAKLKVSTM